MTSKLVVNTIEADTGISSVSFASSISMSSTSKFHFGDAGIDIGADTNINRPAAGVLGFNVNGAEKVRIDSSGRLLIGTTTEGHPAGDNLTVADSGHAGITIRSGTTSNGALYFSDGTSGSDEYRGGVVYHHDGNYMRFYTNGTERVRFTSSGSVAIGTNSATANALTLGGTAAAVICQNPNSGYGTNQGFYFGNGNGTIGYVWNYENDQIRCATNNTERLRIGNAGQLGIAGANYGTSGQVLTSQGSGSAPVWANAGITMADQWRITSSYTLPGSVATLNINWARAASPSGYGKIGSAMSESSGFFTFPSTGVYLIEFTILLAATSAQRYLGHRVQTTIDNFSSAQTVAEQLGHMGLNNSFGAYHTSSSSYIFDVTNTSTHKIRFAGVAFTPSATSVIGNANQNSTFASFIRLGDT